MFVSSSDYEGISNSMMEAMAVGLPCICTDCPAGGASLMIENEVSGLLTPVGDRKALADAMIRLIENPEFAESLGEHAVYINEKYSQDTICGAWLDEINKVMGI